MNKILLRYRLIKTKRRLTFDILEQDKEFFCGITDDVYSVFHAANGIEIISRSRMDVQTDRLWLLGCGPDERSGSMVFSSDEKRDKMFDMFQEALYSWGNYINQSYIVEYEQVVLEDLGNETFEIKLK